MVQFFFTTDNVHYQNAAQLMKLLTEAGIQFELQVVITDLSLNKNATLNGLPGLGQTLNVS